MWDADICEQDDYGEAYSGERIPVGEGSLVEECAKDRLLQYSLSRGCQSVCVCLIH